MKRGMEQNPRQYGVKSKDTETQRENRKALMKRMRKGRAGGKLIKETEEHETDGSGAVQFWFMRKQHRYQMKVTSSHCIEASFK